MQHFVGIGFTYPPTQPIFNITNIRKSLGTILLTLTNWIVLEFHVTLSNVFILFETSMKPPIHAPSMFYRIFKRSFVFSAPGKNILEMNYPFKTRFIIISSIISPLNMLWYHGFKVFKGWRSALVPRMCRISSSSSFCLLQLNTLGLTRI